MTVLSRCPSPQVAPRARHYAEALGEEAGRALARPRQPHEWIELALEGVRLLPGCHLAAELLQLATALAARNWRSLGARLLDLLPLGRGVRLALQLRRRIADIRRGAEVGARVAARAAVLAAA